MRAKRLCLSLILLALPALADTFGTVVARPEGFADIVLDESRRRLYLVNTTMNQIEIYNTATNPPSRGTPIRVGAQPISLAMSRDSRLLYVTCYYDSVLDTVDLDKATVVQRVPLAAKPEGVAVGGDGRVVIGTIGTGTGQASLIIFDPSASATNSLTTVVITPPATPAPLLPPPSGRTFLSANGRLMATRDGRRIIGVNNASNNRTRTVFVYDVASGTVLLSRSVPNASTVLSISPDGTRFMAGPTLFDTATLSVLAQQNTANSPFVFPTGSASNFNLQQVQGGSVFSADGANLYSAFNVAPVQSPPSRANVSRLLLNDPNNLLIRFGLQLTENLAGKMVITSDGNTIYALSESGFLVLPIGRAFDSPIAIPETNVLLLVNDQCGVNASQKQAQLEVQDVGGGTRMTVTANLLQLPNSGPIGLGGTGAGGGGSAGNISILLPPVVPGTAGRPANVPASAGNVGNAQAAVIQTSPQIKLDQQRKGANITFNFNSLAARALGTVAPHDFLLQSPEAINIPPVVRIYQNNRNSEAKGTIAPVSIGISNSEGLVDMVTDSTRQRLYIANSGQNRVEVFDMRQQKFLSPIRVGQLPRSLALDGDGQTLYVANSGGENISIVDLTKMEETGRIAFPPIPFNAGYALVTPSVIAYSVRGLQIIMSDGSLWKVVGNQAIPRMIVNHPVLGNMRTLSGPHRTMAATPEGNYVLFLAGNGMGYLYDARVDDFVRGTQVAPTPITGYFGPIGAGPNGNYYLVNGALLNSSLTTIATQPQYTYNPGTTTPTPSTDPATGPIPGLPSGNFPSRGGPVTLSRPVSAVAPAGARTFVRFSGPIRTSQNQLAADAGVVELVDATNGRTTSTVNALETPLAAQVGNQRVNTNGRTIAVDAAGTTAYALTTSGLSILPLGTATAARDLPAVNRNGVVSTASYLTSMATGSLISIFGRNLGSTESGAAPYPTLLGGVCVTLNNTPLPLIMSSPTQINAQLPPNLNAGNYSMVVRAIDRQLGSATTAVRVAKYAPAVFVNEGIAAIFHPGGSAVTPDHPAKRDEQLVIYATGLGPTKGGKVTAGAPAPSNPLAVTEKVQVFFGNPGYREAEQIVEWSGLTPGYVGLYQINIRVPGAHIKGKALPVQIRIGGVNSPSSGPAVPVIAVE